MFLLISKTCISATKYHTNATKNQLKQWKHLPCGSFNVSLCNSFSLSWKRCHYLYEMNGTQRNKTYNNDKQDENEAVVVPYWQMLLSYCMIVWYDWAEFENDRPIHWSHTRRKMSVGAEYYMYCTMVRFEKFETQGLIDYSSCYGHFIKWSLLQSSNNTSSSNQNSLPFSKTTMTLPPLKFAVSRNATTLSPFGTSFHCSCILIFAAHS